MPKKNKSIANEEKTRFRSTFYFEGKQYETTGKSQKDADQKAAIKKNKLERGEIGISSNMTVCKWAAEWLETYKQPAIGKGQYNNYAFYIGIMNQSIGSLTLKNVKDIHLQKVINMRTGNSKSDVSKLRMTIKGIFRRAYKAKLISYDPSDDLALPIAKDGTHRSITDYEREKILALAETHHAGLWVKTILYAGLRPNETRALDWRHIDFKKRLINIASAMKADTTDIDDPKSNAGIRSIPINEKLLPSLLAARGDPFDPVFKQPTTGKRHTERSMGCLWNNFKRLLDISMGAKLYRNQIVLSVVAKDLVPYCLRHTYCTDLQDAGVPINIAKYLMGHANIAVTSKIYTHTTETTLIETAKTINSYARKVKLPEGKTDSGE